MAYPVFETSINDMGLASRGTYRYGPIYSEGDWQIRLDFKSIVHISHFSSKFSVILGRRFQHMCRDTGIS